METIAGSGEQKFSSRASNASHFSRGSRRAWQLLLRALAASAALAAALTMAFNEETTSLGVGLTMHADYKLSPTMRSFVIVNAIVCAYTFVSLPVVTYCGNGSVVQLMDMLTMVLVAAAAASETSEGLLAKNGNMNTGWLAVCDYVHKFCARSTISVGCSYVSFLLHYLVCTMNTVQNIRRSD